MKIDFPLAVLTQASLIANRSIVPIPEFIPELSCEIDDPIFNDYWSRIRSWTYLDIYKAKSVWDLALEAKDLPGDFIECGCHRGGLGFLLGFLIEHFKLNKRVFLCDSFEGMPEPDPVFDTYYQKGMLKSDLENCRNFINTNALQSTAIVLPGWFEETLPSFGQDQKFALIHIDCDIYQSTLSCFENLYSKASARAPLIMDDFYIPPSGERLAAMQWIGETKETLYAGPLSQVYVRKGITDPSAAGVVEDVEGWSISLRELALNKPYVLFLKGVLERSRQEFSNLSQLIDAFEKTGHVDQKHEKV